MMVLPDDAKLFYPREKLLAVNENHSQIAKVKRGEGGIYPRIRFAINRALFGAADTPAITQVSAPQEPPTCPREPPTWPQEPPTSPQEQPTNPQKPPISRQEPPTSPRTMQDVNARSKIDKAPYSREEIDRLEKVSKPT